MSVATLQLDSNKHTNGVNNGAMHQILFTTASSSEMEPETEQEGPAILERACYWRRMLNAHSQACSSGDEAEDMGQQRRFSPRRGQGPLAGRGGVRANTLLRTRKESEAIIPSPYRRRAAAGLFSPDDQSVVSFSGSADGKRSMNEGSSRAILSALGGVGGGGGAVSMDALFRQYAPRFAHTCVNTAENRRGGGGSPTHGGDTERRASSVVSSTITHHRRPLTAASEAEEALRRKKAEEAARRLLMGASRRGAPANGSGGAAKDARSSSRPSTTGIASSSLVSSLLMRNKAAKMGNSGKNTFSPPSRERPAVASTRRGDNPQRATNTNQKGVRPIDSTSTVAANRSLLGIRGQDTTAKTPQTIQTVRTSGKAVVLSSSSSTPHSSFSRTGYRRGAATFVGGEGQEERRKARKSLSPPPSFSFSSSFFAAKTSRLDTYGGLGASEDETAAQKEEYVVSLRLPPPASPLRIGGGRGEVRETQREAPSDGREGLFSPIKQLGNGNSALLYADPFAPAGSSQLSKKTFSFPSRVSFSPSPTRGNKGPIATTISSSSAPAQYEDVIEIDGVSVLISREGRNHYEHTKDNTFTKKGSESCVHIGQSSHLSSCTLFEEEEETKRLEEEPPKSVLKDEKDHTAPPSPTLSESESSGSKGFKGFDIKNNHLDFDEERVSTHRKESRYEDVRHSSRPLGDFAHSYESQNHSPTAEDRRRLPLARLEPNNTQDTSRLANSNTRFAKSSSGNIVVGSNTNGSSKQNEQKLWDELQPSCTPTVTTGGNTEGRSRHNVVDHSAKKSGGTVVTGRGVNSTPMKASSTTRRMTSQRHQQKYTKTNSTPLLLGRVGDRNHPHQYRSEGEEDEEDDDLVIKAMAQRVALLEEKLAATLSERMRLRQQQQQFSSAHSPSSTHRSISRDKTTKQTASFVQDRPSPRPTPPVHAREATYYHYASAQQNQQQHHDSDFVGSSKRPVSNDVVATPRRGTTTASKSSIITGNVQQHTPSSSDQQHHQQKENRREEQQKDRSDNVSPLASGAAALVEEEERSHNNFSYHRHVHHHHIHLDESSSSLTSYSPTRASSLVVSTDLLIIKSSSSDVRGRRGGGEEEEERESEEEIKRGRDAPSRGAKRALHDDSLYIDPLTSSTSSNTHTNTAQYGVRPQPQEQHHHHHHHEHTEEAYDGSMDPKKIVRKTYLPIAKVSACVANFIE